MAVTFAHGKALMPRWPCAIGIAAAATTRGFSTVTVASVFTTGSGVREYIIHPATAAAIAMSAASVTPTLFAVERGSFTAPSAPSEDEPPASTRDKVAWA